MAVAAIVALILLAKHASKTHALPTLSTSSSGRPCVEFMLPVSATAQNHLFDTLRVDTDINAVSYAVDLDTRTSPNGTERILGNIDIDDTFGINAKLCVPPNGAKKDMLQIASHGLVFDQRYWDVRIEPDEYSYVDAALDSGYSILTYDRLATGKSEKPNGYKVAQAPLELDILRSTTEMARNGDLIKHAYGGDGNETGFRKIIHVGHSYGSALTLGFLYNYGNMSDAAIITGVLPAKDFSPPTTTSFGYEKAENLPSGYLITGTKEALQAGFLSTRVNKTTRLGGFAPKLLDYGFLIRQQVTVGQWSSGVKAGMPYFGISPEFTGPIQFMEGEFDFIACGGDCRGQATEKSLSALYPNATNVNLHLQEGSGHGLTLHKGARKGYEVTFAWLNRNGM